MLNGLEEIEGLTPEQVEAINAKAEGLINKKTELETKLSKVKAGSESSNAEIEALRQFKSNAEIKAAEDAKNWEEATRLKEEAWEKERADLQKSSSESSQTIEKLLIGDGLSRALDSVRVNPALKQGAEAILRANAKVAEGQAMIGDKSLSEAVKEWSNTDAGKAFCLAAENSNGDGNGAGNKSANEKTETNEKAEAAKKKGDLSGFLSASMSQNKQEA